MNFRSIRICIAINKGDRKRLIYDCVRFQHPKPRVIEATQRDIPVVDKKKRKKIIKNIKMPPHRSGYPQDNPKLKNLKGTPSC